MAGRQLYRQDILPAGDSNQESSPTASSRYPAPAGDSNKESSPDEIQEQDFSTPVTREPPLIVPNPPESVRRSTRERCRPTYLEDYIF